MKVRDYEDFGYKNSRTGFDDAYDVIGLNGEAGEVAEWVKKAKFREDERHTEEMLKLELGDVLHYVTRMALNHGWTLKELMGANAEKCRKRQK